MADDRSLRDEVADLRREMRAGFAEIKRMPAAIVEERRSGSKIEPETTKPHKPMG